MVSLPVEFVATKLPGYFWNTKTKQLFTAKLGVLKVMVLSRPNTYNKLTEPAYRVSNKGRRQNLYLSYLQALVPETNSVFPCEFVAIKGNTNDDVAVQTSRLPAGTRVRVIIEG